MKINIKIPSNGKLYTIEDIFSETTIYNIKTKLSSKINEPENKIKFIFSGKILKNETNISDTELKDSSTIFCILSNNNTIKPSNFNTTDTNTEPLLNTSSNNMSNILNNPVVTQMMTQIMSNPELMSQMINNPMIQQMRNNPMYQNPDIINNMMANPQMLEMMNHMMSNPEIMTNALNNMNTSSLNTNSTNTASNTSSDQNNFENLKEKYKEQISKINELGFNETSKIIAILKSCNGNVDIAIDRLLS